MTVPRRIRLKPLREERKYDSSFLILCLLFLVSKVLDIYTLINAYWVFGRETFNPINNFFVRRVLGLPGVWLGDYELSPLNSFALYRFGVPGLLVLQAFITTTILVGVVIGWRASYRWDNTRQQESRFFIKALLYGLTLINVLFAILSSLAVPLDL